MNTLSDYRLYLDDERQPSSDDWEVARTLEEFQQVITQKGLPYAISFDHDLGNPEGPSGKTCADWLVEKALDEGWPIESIDFNVHSANPVGAENIRSLLDNYVSFSRGKHSAQ